MLPKKPSHTAMRVAIWRAAHQLVDARPLVLDDPLALPILGPEEAARLRQRAWLEKNPGSDAGRTFIVARARFAEDELRRAVSRGVAQVVVLGAGLDTFAYRSPYAGAVRVFEVDHPATQAWKRERLAEAGIDVPPWLSYAPTDFESEGVAEGLARAGFSRELPAFFSWLGVTMYLTASALSATFGFIAATPPGGGVVFDYMLPLEELPILERFVLRAMSLRVAMVGEPFRARFRPHEMQGYLARFGFHDVIDLDKRALNDRYYRGRPDDLRITTSQARLVSAQI
jgi:methyltransferase (TIGR00027 family)